MGRKPEETANSGQYFSEQPTAESRPQQVRWELPDMVVNLWTDRGVFSRRRVDRGTDLLARTMELPAEGEILDLGAGYGPLAIVAARRAPATRVTLVEVNQRAAELARQNLALNQVSNAEVLMGEATKVLGERRFAAIVTNPPLRAGKRVVLRLLSEAATRLEPSGALWLVARTKQGAKTLARDLTAWFGQVEVVAKQGGFRVIKATNVQTINQGGE